MPKIKVVDVIHHRNQNYTQQMLVLDRMPEFVYEREGNFLIAEDSGFFGFYGYERSGPNWKAFGGDKFDIPLKNGSIIKADGQWWDSVPSDYSELVISIGIKTIERLEECYVFSYGYVDPLIVDNWLSTNDPSNNYNKYDKRNIDYGKHHIISK